MGLEGLPPLNPIMWRGEDEGKRHWSIRVGTSNATCQSHLYRELKSVVLVAFMLVSLTATFKYCRYKYVLNMLDHSNFAPASPVLCFFLPSFFFHSHLWLLQHMLSHYTLNIEQVCKKILNGLRNNHISENFGDNDKESLPLTRRNIFESLIWKD